MRMGISRKAIELLTTGTGVQIDRPQKTFASELHGRGAEETQLQEVGRAILC